MPVNTEGFQTHFPPGQGEITLANTADKLEGPFVSVRWRADDYWPVELYVMLPGFFKAY